MHDVVLSWAKKRSTAFVRRCSLALCGHGTFPCAAAHAGWLAISIARTWTMAMEIAIVQVLAGKLWRARSPLYQRQILQVNIHFSGFFEIYQIRIPSHRCKFKISRFFSFFVKISADFRDFANFCRNFAIFLRNFHRILPEFREISDNCRM